MPAPGQAQQSAFAVGCMPGAEGKQASSGCAPCQGGCRSEQLCVVVLRDTHVSGWFQSRFKEAKDEKHPNVSSG